jgi:hypothetical protein
MSEMFINTPKNGYWLKEAAIKKAEHMYSAKYMGYWCTKRLNGESWNDNPVDVFYQPNPNRELGHSNYFGLFFQNDNLWITDAQSAFSDPITGIETDDGEVIVSRYRHNYVEKDKYMIDGGRDYLRTSGGPFVRVRVEGPEFVIERIVK